jgi:SPX domain protein involved in polyphosphate accumulation
MIGSFVKHDKYCKDLEEHHYTVRSIYFDTAEYACYFEKVEGIKHRKKFRLRSYNLQDSSASNVFFEIKRKFESPILKNRAPVSFSQALTYFSGNELENYHPDIEKYPQAKDDLKRFFFHFHAGKMRPVILIIYEREAFLGLHDENIRVTFDKNLRSVAFPELDELYNEEKVRHSFNNQFVLEVKFNDHFPSWMKPIIGTLGLVRQSVSKYVISIDTHNFIKPKKLPSVFSRTRMSNYKNR